MTRRHLTGLAVQDINLVADPARNFLVIMKDGKVQKNLFMSAAR